MSTRLLLVMFILMNSFIVMTGAVRAELNTAIYLAASSGGGTIPHNRMTAVTTSQETVRQDNSAIRAIDDDASTMWHTAWASPLLPQSITLNLGGAYTVNQVKYLPRQKGDNNGIITSYRIYLSTNGTNFTQVASGSWALDASEKRVSFTPQSASYVRLEATAGYGNWVSAAEINIDYTTSAPSTPTLDLSTSMTGSGTITKNPGGTNIDGLPRVSANGRYLERSDGTPFVLLSDTEWRLNEYSDSEVATILDNRAAKGFTAVQVFATRVWAQTDYDGNTPFNSNDPTSLVAGYWNGWRRIADQAASRGLYFILVMGGPGRNNEPWQVANTTEAYHYARQVGIYFAASKNIIFAQGLDSKAEENTSYWRAMAEGVADGVNGVNNFDGSADYSTTLQTYHGYRISSYFHNDDWIDFYGPEIWHDVGKVYGEVKGYYNLGSPVRPVFLMEGWYENEAIGKEVRQPAHDVRVEAWHSFLGGICGYAYGHFDNWNQLGDTAFLDAEGAQNMAQLASFANQHNWWLWSPDNSVITANAGSGKTRRVGVKSSKEIVVYYPTSSASTIQNTLSSPATATWFDPRNGNTSSGGTFAASQSRNMTPPTGWTDALLVLSNGDT